MLCFDINYEKSGKHGYRGIQVTAGMSKYVSERVSRRYHDVQGSREIAERFSALSHTEFEDMTKSLHLKREYDEYGIAEAFVECFLEDYCHAKFPYVSARDNKNPRAYQTGADLVGFFYTKDRVYFLFGEVKLSHETKYPPTVTRKKPRGLVEQLKNFGSDEARSNLILWFAQKMLRSDDREDYYRAWRFYNKDKTRFKIVGAIVRTVNPKPRDLDGLFVQLAPHMPSQHFEMIAIYVNKSDLALVGEKR